jgi:hypothetical protein
MQSITAMNQWRSPTGNPATDPNSQGDQGGNNASARASARQRPAGLQRRAAEISVDFGDRQ